MKKIILVLALILPSACASMHERVHAHIQIGDPATKVTELLGAPDSFQPSQKIEGAEAWYYTKGRDVCGFAVKDEKIALLGCADNPKYVSGGMVVGSILKGMGDGMQNSNRDPSPASARSTNCISNVSGSYVYTNCN